MSRSLFKGFVDLCLPLQCVKCGEIVKEADGLCSQCWPLVTFISKPYCACCGLPFEFEIEEGSLCGECSSASPSYQTGRSVFVYSEGSKDLILKLKHMDCLWGAPLFARWMGRVLERYDNPLCVPVPLHWTRLFRRTYNQAALLASCLARDQGWTYAPSLLKRGRRTSSQGHLSRKERVKNVEGAFQVCDKKTKDLRGRSVLLIDDVFTTGATLESCAKALLKGGAKDVHTLTLGRVVKG